MQEQISAEAAQHLEPAPVGEPFSATELVRDLSAVRDWGLGFWRTLGDEEFFAPVGEAWSPADHVRHLVKSNRPVARALALPRILLLLRFGFALRPSRSYTALRSDYREALRGGLRAGSFAPRPLAPSERTAETRGGILDTWSGTLTALASVTRKWSEGALDRLRLPHPGIGMLTVREMLFFSLYHNTHHVLGAATRRPE